MSFIIAALVLLGMLFAGAGEAWLPAGRTAWRRQIGSLAAGSPVLVRVDFGTVVATGIGTTAPWGCGCAHL